ncbi:hypothetical protein HAX54_037196 [Datura stramonium]|uniref:CRAL-TRIO domain-containing protein n=1 Tax=Datura stramonium TaxID=4076 RepID=A0ABS8VJP4_DATST|nr:hypothetical protein [Datura stramonium]
MRTNICLSSASTLFVLEVCFSTEVSSRKFYPLYMGLLDHLLREQVSEKLSHIPLPSTRRSSSFPVASWERLLRAEISNPKTPVAVIMFRWKSHRHCDQECEDQPHKVKELRTSLAPLSGRNLQYCNDACLRRYLEARNWNVDKSKKMMEESLKWRSSFKPEEILWHEVAVEGETGKAFRANFRDRCGRTVLILRPGMQNTTALDNQMRHLVYLIENAILNLPQGQEQMSWLIDFTGWSLTNNVPIKSARETVNILQNHYPERLAIAFLYNPPRIFEAFWKIVKYFLDPKTMQKVKFVYPKNKDSVELMKSYFDMDNLPTELGGKANLKYDHEEFSRQMAQDDVKAAKFWSFDKHHTETNGYSAAGVGPKTECLAPPVTV